MKTCLREYMTYFMSKNTNFISGKYHVTVDYFNQIRYELLSAVWHFKIRCTYKVMEYIQPEALTSIVPIKFWEHCDISKQDIFKWWHLNFLHKLIFKKMAVYNCMHPGINMSVDFWILWKSAKLHLRIAINCLRFSSLAQDGRGWWCKIKKNVCNGTVIMQDLIKLFIPLSL